MTRRRLLTLGGLAALSLVAAVSLLFLRTSDGGFYLVAGPKTFLRDLMSAQELYRQAHGRYATSLEGLDVEPRAGIAQTTIRADSTGYLMEIEMAEGAFEFENPRAHAIAGRAERCSVGLGSFVEARLEGVVVCE